MLVGVAERRVVVGRRTRQLVGRGTLGASFGARLLGTVLGWLVCLFPFAALVHETRLPAGFDANPARVRGPPEG